MIIISEKTGKKYSGGPEAIQHCQEEDAAYDKKMAEEKAHKEALIHQQEQRRKEIDDAYNKALNDYNQFVKLVDDYMHDYGHGGVIHPVHIPITELEKAMRQHCGHGHDKENNIALNKDAKKNCNGKCDGTQKHEQCGKNAKPVQDENNDEEDDFNDGIPFPVFDFLDFMDALGII